MDHDQIETSGRTVEDALNAALKQLNASFDDVEFTVLDEGKRGIFFGALSRDARVSVRRVTPAAETAQPSSTPTSTEKPGGEGEAKDDSESRNRRRRGGRGRGRNREDQPEKPETGKQSPGSRRTGTRDTRPRSRRNYETPTPELSDTDFLPRQAGDEAAADAEPEAPAETPATAERSRSRRGGSRAGGESRNRNRDRDRQQTPVVEPNIDHELVDVAATVVDDILRILQVDADINLREPLTPGDGRGSALAVIDITGDDLGALIGRRGETLLNLQYLVNLIVTRRYPNEGGVTIDIAYYRHRREEQLVDLATRMAERVRDNGSPITLEPMAAADRRLVHLALAEDPDIETHSTGDGEERKVVIRQRN